MVREESVQKLKGRLRGRLIQPGDEGYDDARRVYNGMIDRKPAYLAQCVDVADVLAACLPLGALNALDADALISCHDM